MPSASVISRQSTVQPLFEPQPQETILNHQTLSQLPTLKRPYEKNSDINKTLEDAIKLLTDSAVEINDWASAERDRRQKKLAKLRKNEEIEPEEEQEDFESFQQKVREMTDKMDKSIQGVIDDRTWIEGVPASIQLAIDKSKEMHDTAQTPYGRRRANDNDDDDSDAEEDEVNDSTMRRPEPAEALSTLISAAQTKTFQEWTSKSLTDRYARDEAYKDFYTLLYDAKNPGSARPPCPAESLWFAEASNTRVATASQRLGSTQHTDNLMTDSDEEMDDSDAELMIAAENQRITCPLTLRPFTDPVTSKKCPHSFEKSAILELIRKSRLYAPFTPAQQSELSAIRNQRERQHREAQIGTRVAQCPECSVRLSESDLRDSPVLLRHVKRVLEAQRRDRERENDMNDDDDDEEDDEDEGPRPSQRRRIVQLGSSPVRDGPNRRRTLIKGELRSSMVPDSQT